MRLSIAKVTTLSAVAALALFGAAGSAAAYGHHPMSHVEHEHCPPKALTVVTGGDADVHDGDGVVIVTGGDAKVHGGGNAIVTGGDAWVDNDSEDEDC